MLGGCNTYVCDPQTGSVISDAWCQNLLDLGVKQVRVDLRADTSNHLPQALYVRGVERFMRHGITPVGVISEDFNRPWLEGNPNRTFYPNEALGYQNNKRHNRWILDTCVRAGMFAKAMVGAGMTHFATANESNLQGSIAIGANVPPVAGDKSGALAPEVFASYAYELAGWLRNAGATHIEYGAQSWIAGSGPDKNNPYCAGYLRKGFAYLRSTGAALMETRKGVQAPRFDSLSTNSEGWWVEETADAMAHAISDAAATFGWNNPPLIIGEWGERADAFNPVYFQETAAALASVATEMYLETHPCRTPNNLKDYSLIDWIDAGGYLAPGPGRSVVYAPFKALLSA